MFYLILEEKWTITEILQLEFRIKVVIEQIKLFPDLYPKSHKMPHLHKALIDKNNYIIYRVMEETIEILLFEGTKQKDF